MTNTRDAATVLLILLLAFAAIVAVQAATQALPHLTDIAIADGATTITQSAMKHRTSWAALDCPLDNIGLILADKDGRRLYLCEIEPGVWGEILEDFEQGKRTIFHALSRGRKWTLCRLVRMFSGLGFTEVVQMRPDLVDELAQAMCSDQ